MNLRESSVLVAFTQRVRNGERQGLTVASKLLIDYLVPRVHRLEVIDQPIRTDPDTAPIHSLYINGELNFRDISLWGPTWEAEVMLSDLFAVWDAGNGWAFSSQRSKLFDLFIAGEQLNGFVGWVLKKRGRIGKLAYVPADVSDYGMLHGFVKKRADYVWPLTISLCPPIKEENFKPRSEPVIGYIGALEERFGVDKLIEALPLILREVPSARVEIIGA